MKIKIAKSTKKTRLPMPRKPPKREPKANAYGGKKARREWKRQIARGQHVRGLF